MKTYVQKTKRGFTLVELLVVIAIIASLAGASYPVIIDQQKKGAEREAASNAYNIAVAMKGFETEYGSLPDASTAATVLTNTETTIPMDGTSANGALRQLIGAGYTKSEKIFYAKAANTKKPDGNITGSEALAPGEVGFGYIVRGTTGLSNSGHPEQPFLVTPLLGNSGNNFDANPFGGKAVVLRMDFSINSLQILPSKKINLSPGKELLATGADTVWGEATDSGNPTILFPLPKS